MLNANGASRNTRTKKEQQQQQKNKAVIAFKKIGFYLALNFKIKNFKRPELKLQSMIIFANEGGCVCWQKIFDLKQKFHEFLISQNSFPF